MRLVPLYERFAIWVVPSLYLGIALCIDAGIRAGQNAYRQRRHVHTATAVLVTVAVLWLCGNVAAQGWHVIQIARPDNSNHQLDDRMAVEWLLAQHERGVVLTTRLALLRCGGAAARPFRRRHSVASCAIASRSSRSTTLNRDAPVTVTTSAARFTYAERSSTSGFASTMCHRDSTTFSCRNCAGSDA